MTCADVQVNISKVSVICSIRISDLGKEGPWIFRQWVQGETVDVCAQNLMALVPLYRRRHCIALFIAQRTNFENGNCKYHNDGIENQVKGTNHLRWMMKLNDENQVGKLSKWAVGYEIVRGGHCEIR